MRSLSWLLGIVAGFGLTVQLRKVLQSAHLAALILLILGLPENPLTWSRLAGVWLISRRFHAMLRAR